jgi:hypothetical protein
MRAAALVLCLGAVAGVSGQSRPAHHVLDVVTYPVASESGTSSAPAGVPAGHVSAKAHDRSAVNLRARLVSLDFASYETGDPVIYEIEVENMGRTPVVLPWSPDSVRVSRESDGESIQAIISLEVWDGGGSRRRLGTLEPLSLSGSANVAGSLQSLGPREIALIRVPGRWRAVESERRAMVNEPGGNVQVKGVITLVQDQVTVRTTNGIPVSLRLRR